ncbi:hypothetical protein BAVI_15311 [Neobacillus vireti LMG 21834]|uniref:DUF4878 domain-containing protein n=2 Tax=Neobacillus TaxID=2675232 RepID=A0AB94ILE7_9BACI|nr:hypothetical protein BAVI_15311 [Neobacillus vireti LMG 21834]KLT17296.1 hypothetical protein AA980_15575 [Neobacillus vireti]
MNEVNHVPDFIKRLIKGKLCFALFLLLSFNGLSVEAATKDEALKAVENFLKAQKNCNVDIMVDNSEYFLKIENLKEMYTELCHKSPLKQAKITKFSLINEETALVSIQATYKEMINIRTTPVIKKDGKWKIVIGVPPAGVKNTNVTKRTAKEAEIAQLFKDYTDSIKARDMEKMKSFIKILPDSPDEKIEEHLQALSEQPIPEIITYGINYISESLAIVQVEIKFPKHTYAQNLSVTNENGQWKMIYGHLLTNSFIPNTGKSIDIK